MKQRTPKWDRALEGLTHEEAESIHRLMRPATYEPRTPLFHAGEPSTSLVVVRNGRVRLYLSSANGDEFTLSILTGGSILGLAAAVLGRPRILSVESIGRVDASILPVAEMNRCMEALPRFARNITGLLAVLAVENIERSGPLALDSAASRLGAILLTLSTQDTDPQDGLPSLQGLTQEDLAKMVGTTRTWVTLTLADFERKGFIRKSPGRITLIDAAGLQRYLDANPGR
ncbi:MAG: Crp/Fnr family transcriptional regulator [Burkholderiaceae bacterium]